MCTLSTLDRTEVYAPQRLEPETEAASWRLLFEPDVFLQHPRGFVPGLLSDLEFRHPIIECRRSETGALRVGAIAVEAADAGAPQCPLKNPRYRGRV